MAKTTNKGDKQTVSTNAMFKRPLGRPTRTVKSNKDKAGKIIKSSHLRKSKALPEHSLATKFSGKCHRSRRYLITRIEVMWYREHRTISRAHLQFNTSQLRRGLRRALATTDQFRGALRPTAPGLPRCPEGPGSTTEEGRIPPYCRWQAT